MDWDKDGKLDILSGCYKSPNSNVAFFYFLKGTGGLNFEAAKKVTTTSGKPLLIKVPTKDPGNLYKYSNICTQHSMADLNADGHPEVLIGGFAGCFVEFKGSPGQGINRFADGGAFLKDINGKILKAEGGKSNPQLVDWDRDGDFDLISGSSQGAVYYFENVGSKTQAKWKPAQTLIPNSSASFHQKESAGIKPGRNSRVCVYDYNNDGLLDLVMGDRTVVIGRDPAMSDADYNKKVADHKAALQKVKDISRNKSLNAKDRKNQVRRASSSARAMANRYNVKRTTGHIWVFLQKK